MSGLTWNIKNGDINAVKTSVEQGADVNEMTDGRYPLHYAADYGQTEVLEYLISKGASVNAPDKYGITPLLSAIFENHADCVKLLLEKGADKSKLHDGQAYVTFAESEAVRNLLK